MSQPTPEELLLASIVGNKDEAEFRDMCAAMAMMGDWASQTPGWTLENPKFEGYAKRYFKMADAMVKARREQTK